jgi:hypothetical protein
MDSQGLLALKGALDDGSASNIMNYLNEKGIDEKPMAVRRQLVDEFGRDAMMPIFQKIRNTTGSFPNRISMIVNRFNSLPSISEDDCDAMINALSEGVQSVIDKKGELNS